MRPKLPLLLLLASLAGACTRTQAQEWLDRMGDHLSFSSEDGLWRGNLSGWLDGELYYSTPNPPGLIFPTENWFLNPRAVLVGQMEYGDRWFSMVQARADRGFDPGLRRGGDARLDEYLLRYKADLRGRLNLQAGKFATVFGGWVPRHLSWDNPFVTAPLPYENVTIMTDGAVPGAPGGFLGRQAVPDRKNIWVPVIWGPSYASGAAAFGSWGRLDYALEFKNAGLASRPTVWDATQQNWRLPTWTGRLGFRPNASWNVGMSFSDGPYVLRAPAGAFPAGTDASDFHQSVLGWDVSYAWRKWQFWGEGLLSTFEVPNVGDASTWSYFLEVRRKLTPSLFAALRWNQQGFGKVPDGLGGTRAWDQGMVRVDSALTWRWNRHWQTKVQYSISDQEGPFQQGRHLLALQWTLKF